MNAANAFTAMTEEERRERRMTPAPPVGKHSNDNTYFPEEREMDVIQGRLLPLFDELGFEGCGRHYNRTTADGLVHVVRFQVGQRWMSDQFTVNLGIYIPELPACAQEGEQAIIREVCCAIRTRLGELDAEPDDMWWILEDHPDLTTELSRRFREDAMPFFAKFGSREQCLLNLEALADVGIVDAEVEVVCDVLGGAGSR